MASIDTIADRSTGTTVAGKAYFETSTNKFIVYNGGAWIELDSDGTGAVAYQNRWGASFDGSDDYLTANDSSLDLKNNFSISCWFYRASGDVAWSGLVSWGEQSVGKYRSIGFNSNNNLVFNAYATGYTSSGQTISDSTWYHAVLTLSGAASNADAKVYINGVLDSTVSGIGLLDYATYGGQVIGGSGYGGTERFEGMIDDIAIFNSALDQTAITALYNSGVPDDLSSYSPVGWWRMGDDSNDSATSGGSIATITDSSGNGNDATQITASKQPTFSDLTGETIYA